MFLISMKKLLIVLLCGLSMIIMPAFTPTKSIEVENVIAFTLSWDVSGGQADIVILGLISLTMLQGSGSATLDVDPNGYAISISASSGYVMLSHKCRK